MVDELLTKSTNFTDVTCQQHNLYCTLFCTTCKDLLCSQGQIDSHLGDPHKIQKALPTILRDNARKEIQIS